MSNYKFNILQISVKKGKPIDPATGEPMDDEWDGATSAERSIAQKNKRKKLEESTIQERVMANSATPVARRTPSQMAAARSANNRVTRPPLQVSSTTAPSPPASGQVSAPPSNEEKKRQQIFNQKIQSTLLKHKEQLKRDISKKRGMQEKELTLDIKRDIEKIKGSALAGKTVTLTNSSASPVPVSTF